MTIPLVVHGIDRHASADSVRDVVRQVFESASNGCPWLKSGDKVLLKVALNSPDPYPATTSPFAVRAVVEALRERGARVLVGDMPGVEYVVLSPKGNLKRTSRSCFEASGMGADSQVDFVGFEERGWDDGFFHFESERAISWPEGFHITKLVREVDHIIALPRLSTHTQGGITLGFKLAVGYLRPDSRMVFHSGGPFYSMMKTFVRDAGIPTDLPKQHRFFERITEINLAVAERQRLTLCFATEGQVTFGPDRHVPYFHLPAHRVVPDTGLVFASENPVAVELLGIAFLARLFRQSPWYHRLMERILMWAGGQTCAPGDESPWQNPFVRHALAVGLGSADFELRPTNVPGKLLDDLTAWMAAPAPRTDFSAKD